jgi:hypothetical protein
MPIILVSRLSFALANHFTTWRLRELGSPQQVLQEWREVWQPFCGARRRSDPAEIFRIYGLLF